MKAIQITAQGAPDVLTEVELPDPQPAPGQVLIDVQAASVNFSDVMRRRGSTYPFPTLLPFVPGSEVAGTIAALGDGVEGPPVGTPVFAAVGPDGSGGYAQKALTSAGQAIPVPDGLSPEQAAGLVVAGTTAALILTHVAPVQAGQTVLIPAAAGGVGTFAVALAKHRGATVIALASSNEKRDLALERGADHAIDPADADWPGQVIELSGGGVDVALEMAGGERLRQSLTTLAPFGSMVVYGMASGAPGNLDERAQSAWLYDPSLGQTVTAFNIGLFFGLRPEAAVAALTELIGLVASGQITPPPVTPLPLNQAAEAHRRLENGETTGKLVLIP